MPGQPEPVFPLMERMTVKMIRAYLDRKKAIIIPIGSIEQHGYHLPVKTDTVIAEQIARRIGEKLDILVAPAIYATYSGGGLPGTINTSPAVMSLIVGDALISLLAQGFRNFYLFLGHGGSENFRALVDGLKVLLKNNPAFEKALIALLPAWKFGLEGRGWKPAFEGGDWHSGWVETSMMLALAPELVRLDELELDPPDLLKLQIEHPDNYQHAEKIVDDEFVVPRLNQRPEIRVGVMGYPERASREIGLRLVEQTVAEASAKIADLESKADGVYKEVKFTPEPIVL